MFFRQFNFAVFPKGFLLHKWRTTKTVFKYVVFGTFSVLFRTSLVLGFGYVYTMSERIWSTKSANGSFAGIRKEFNIRAKREPSKELQKQAKEEIKKNTSENL